MITAMSEDFMTLHSLMWRVLSRALWPWPLDEKWPPIYISVLQTSGWFTEFNCQWTTTANKCTDLPTHKCLCYNPVDLLTRNHRPSSVLATATTHRVVIHDTYVCWGGTRLAQQCREQYTMTHRYTLKQAHRSWSIELNKTMNHSN